MIVFLDRFSRWILLRPVASTDAATATEVFLRDWVAYFGTPAILTSDAGSAFKNSLVKEMCEMLKIKQKLNVPHHPESHGSIERANRTVLATLRILLHDPSSGIRDWPHALPAVQFALNTAINRVTGVTPFMLVHGFAPRLPFHNHFGILHSLSDEPSTVASTLAAFHNSLVQRITDAESAAFKQTLKYYQKNHIRKRIFSIGDYVLERNYTGTKLEFPWNGPHLVAQDLGRGVLELQDLLDGHQFSAHINNLAQFNPPSASSASASSASSVPSVPPVPSAPAPLTPAPVAPAIARDTAPAPPSPPHPAAHSPASPPHPAGRSPATPPPLATALKEGEYLVERVDSHSVAGDGQLWFKVKWVGYEEGVDADVALRDCHWAPAVKDYIRTHDLKPTLLSYGRARPRRRHH